MIPVFFVKIPLERRRVKQGVPLMPSPGLGDERVRESCIELVSGDIQIVPFEPQPDVPLLRICLQLARYHVDGNALVLLTETKPAVNLRICSSWWGTWRTGRTQTTAEAFAGTPLRTR